MKLNTSISQEIIRDSAFAYLCYKRAYQGKLKGKPSKNTINRKEIAIGELEKLDFSKYKKMTLEDMKKFTKYEPFISHNGKKEKNISNLSDAA
jgi:hypothetical protein